jgi:hypothetical protein
MLGNAFSGNHGVSIGNAVPQCDRRKVEAQPLQFLSGLIFPAALCPNCVQDHGEGPLGQSGDVG